MNRWDAIRALAGSILLGLGTLGWCAEVPRIGVMIPPALVSTLQPGLRDSLSQLGYVEGRTIQIEWRQPSETGENLLGIAKELVDAKVHLIAVAGTPAAAAVMSITSAIPVVFASGDPVAAGLAASLARPGRNGTGVSAVTPELSAKNLDLLHQIVPHLKRVAYLQGPVSPLHARHVNEMHAAAKTLRVELQVFSAHSADELDKSLKSIQAGRFDGLVVSSDLLTLTYGERIARAARRARLPAIYPWRDYHEHGALVSYGVSGRAVTQRMARYVDRILRGADPGDLPVEENSTFELVVDLREAAAIGVTVPQSILLRADEVIR